MTAGDLLGKLKSAGEYIVEIVKDTASDAWHFVAAIGGKLFAFVFDAIDKVVASLEAVFRAIVSAVENLVRYLQFLFAWKDILRTKDVIKKIVRLSALVVPMPANCPRRNLWIRGSFFFAIFCSKCLWPFFLS